MFRLHRHSNNKSEKSAGERIDFNFSHFQALQVPKGWDKLLVSMISVETGKTIAKLNKASVRNGNCQWSETLSESIWVSQDESSNQLEESLHKLVVSMGSSRSGILGEAIINLTNYTSSRSSVPVSLPLKKCNHGTVLQVKVQCLTPRKTARNPKLEKTTSHPDETNAESDEIDNKSDASDSTYSRSIGSSSSNLLASNSQPEELGSRNTSFSASGSRHSTDSAEGSIDRINFSPRNNLNGDSGRLDSFGSPRSAIYGGGGAVDLPRSNHSSFNSKFTGSGSNLQTPRQELGTSSLRNADSSKDLLEAAEETIEDLRAEARMWERNARKLLLDMETLKKEFADQSRNQANLDMELSAAHTERDGLKKEIEQLKILLEDSKVKETATDNSKFQSGGMTHIQKELKEEMKYQKESNATLALQLEKTQESNIELVTILQELEDTIEKQRIEIGNLSEVQLQEAEESSNMALQLQELQESQKELQATVQSLEESLVNKNKELELEQHLRSTSLSDVEAEWRSKLSAKDEDIIKLEAKLSHLLNAQGSHEEKIASGRSNSDLITEIETLKEKVQELEKDCNELTDENLDLLFQLKGSKKDLPTGGTSFNSSSNGLQVSNEASSFESEVVSLRSHIYHQLEQELEEKATTQCEEVTTVHLQAQLVDLQNKCTDLEFQLQSSEDKAHDLDGKLCNIQVHAEAQQSEISALKQQLQCYQGSEAAKKQNQLILPDSELEKFKSQSSEEMSKFYSELDRQLQLALAHVKKPWCGISSTVNADCENNLDLYPNAAEMPTPNEQAEAILNNFSDLNKLLEAKITECETVFQQTKVEVEVEVEVGVRDGNVYETPKKLEEISLNETALPIQEAESLKMELEAEVSSLNKELVAKRSEIEKLESGLLLKEEEEIERLRCSQVELEAQILNLQKENGQLGENLEIVSRESSITSKCLEEVRNDMMVLTSNLDSHVAANKMLERNSSELESGKREIEVHLSELEEENIQLSERISGLEAQLRYLTDGKESSRLELENSKSLAMDLRNEILRLESEMETQKVELRQKLLDMQNRWSEAQEECEYLRRANPKLQATAESLIEECATTQRLNAELRRQKLELHQRCTHLEVELRESQKKISECCKQVDILEAAFSSMQDDIASKEKLLTSELDALYHENKQHKEKLAQGENLLNQMYMEKVVEVENLQREVAHLTEQISATHDEREKIASNAVFEVSNLRVDKAKLENALQEAQEKAKSSETKLHALQLESGTKMEGLLSELAISRDNHELLKAGYERLQRLLDDVKSSEEKLKSIVNGLGLKITASEYERQQLVEEIASLKVQLQKIALLQDDIVTLKNSLNEIRFEKGKVEASLQLMTEDCEELKAERISFVEKISSMQKSVFESEDCKRSRVALEEKLLRLEGDLTAKEALCAQDAELKNELSRIKRANSQLQRKIQCLEGEKDECMKRTQALEEELKLKKEEKWHQSKSSNKDIPGFESDTEANTPNGDLKSSEVDNAGLQDLVSKIQLLENELAEALEANSMYKVQLKKLLTDAQGQHANAPKGGGKERKTSSLETELKEIRERYFHMSLRFAEVEAEREELVMKLKSQKSGKRWFS